MFCAVMKARPDVAEIRVRERTAHDAYWAPRMDRIWLAGPILSDDGEQRLGQVMIVHAASRQEAETLIGNDPYVLSGAFEPYTVSRFRPSVEKGQAG